MTIDYCFILACLLAYLLDLILGDPIWLPHPIVLFGHSIAQLEQMMNHGQKRLMKGILVTIMLVSITFPLFYTVMQFARMWHPLFYDMLVAIFLFYGLANKTLIDESKGVFQALTKHGLDGGRRQLSRIVGRDTSLLTAQQIKVAVLETMSENLSDGVVAPLFWFAIGGIPAMMTYKMINTLDSMIGYKNERYVKFGKVAARLDDVANWIPARLTATLMCLVSGSSRSLRFIIRYGHHHSSPNAGYPESALSGILDVQFGGPNRYHGQLVDKLFIGNNPRTITEKDLKKAIRINHLVCIMAFCMAVLARINL